MPQELCPRCRRLVNVTVKKSTTVRTVENIRKRFVNKDFSCESCGAFIKSVEKEDPEVGIQ